MTLQCPLGLAALIASFCLFAASGGKPLQLDNMDFPAVAKQTAATGLPVYYRGEENPKHLGLYHPPLYIYMLALWIKLLGFGEIQVRMFGYMCALLQGWVVLELVRALFGSETAQRITGWFWLLFLLNPYTLQTASIADIDSTIYGPLLCGTLLVLVRMSWRDGVWRSDPVRGAEYAFLCVALVLVLWAKLTTVWLLPPAVLLLLVKRLGLARAFLVATAVTMAAVAVFLLTYFAYGGMTGLDVRYTFAFTLQSLLTRGSSGRPGAFARLDDFRNTFVIMMPILVGWTGLVPWLAAIGAGIAAGWQTFRFRDKRSIHSLVLIVLALGCTAYYCGQTLTFGGAPFKYTFVYWGIIVACAALLLDFLLEASFRASEVPRRRWATMAAAVYFVSALAGAVEVKDTIILTGPVRPYTWPLYIPALVLLAVMPVRRLAPRFAALVLACALSAAAGNSLGVAVYQSRVSYSTTYDYGQTGFEDTVSFIRVNTQPDQVIASMKDIGFKAGRKYIENYSAIYGGPDQVDRLTEAISSGRVRYAVFTVQRGQDNLMMNPRLKSWIEQRCVLVRSFGDYRIYSYIDPKTRQ
jgi:hypothetical protein